MLVLVVSHLPLEVMVGTKIGCVGICGLAFGGDPPGEGGGPGDGAIDCVDGSSGIGLSIEASGAGIEMSDSGTDSSSGCCGT